MSRGSSVPKELYHSIAADLRPVRPLRRPWQRALVLAPLGALLLAGLPLVMGVRHDAASLGVSVLWGLSALQLLYGLVLVAAALRGAVPGRAPTPIQYGSLLVGGGALLLFVTAVTWHVSPTEVPPHRTLYFWRICFATPLGIGVPPLLLAWYMVGRGFPVHPVIVGFLCGLGVGLMVDAGWRTFCGVSQLTHVASSHVAAIVVLSAAGSLLGGARKYIQTKV